MNKKLLKLQYIFADFFASALTWILFYLYRKTRIEPLLYNNDEEPLIFTLEFYTGLLLVPVFFFIFNYLIGFYSKPHHKSRIIELGQTILTSVIGNILIFFYAVLNDPVSSYQLYYNQLFTLIGLHFSFTYLFRVILTSRTKHKIRTRQVGFNTLIIGSNEKAVNIYQDFCLQKHPTGNIFIGFIMIQDSDSHLMENFLPNLGSLEEIDSIIEKYEVEEVIIAIESTEHHRLSEIIEILGYKPVEIKVIPDMFDFLSGLVRTNAIFSSPLLDISTGLIPPWQENIKRLMDIAFSILATFFSLPLILFVIIAIKLSSPGPILFKQKRIGRYGKEFYIYKFRSMYIDAEKNGPELSSSRDVRITPIGRFLRKTHIDEIPQFYNVLRGEMSLVGPRPERAHFINLIKERTHQYSQLHKVRPGITSWGQVKFGYAENVDEMIERMKYDLVYLRNMSIYIDLKILIYTILEVLKGKGK